MSAGAAVRARCEAARALGYPNPHSARLAADEAALQAIDAAGRQALRQAIQPLPVGGPMSLFAHHQAGRLDDRNALLAALADAGWPAGPAEGLVAKVEAGAVRAALPKPRQPWRVWTDDELAAIHATMALRDTVPGRKQQRELADRLGRSMGSVRSQCERYLAEQARRAVAS